MKNTIKIVLFLTLTMLVLLCMPIVSNAASTETATDEESLITAIENVDDGGTVEIQNNITVTKPIVIQKTLTIVVILLQVLQSGHQHLEIKQCLQLNWQQGNLH